MRSLLALIVCLAPAGYAPTSAPADRPRAALRAPARPDACREISSASELRAALTQGGNLCLSPGAYVGPFQLSGSVTVWGPRDAVIRSDGRGTTVELSGEGPALLGVTVDGSGGRFDTLDAAVHVSARGARVERVRVVHAVFGILCEKSERVVVRGNEVQGNPTVALGMRGDGIRLWETRDSLVERNRVEDSRDLVVWYSSNNVVRGNEVRRGRYGTHFMYSHRNQVEDNRYLGNEVGVFVMYSRGITLARNVLAGGTGAAGMGLGIKESGDIHALDNRLVANTIGLYLDQSPLQADEHNLFERNVFRLGEAGVVFHSSQERNRFLGNSLRDNQAAVRVEGGGDALETEWRGNDFGDYAGYDLDRDGVGDVPYELKSLSGDLVDRYPELAFFRGSLALSLVGVAGEVLPLMAPHVVLRDPSPRMNSFLVELPDAD